jgi:hypothetical protein
VKQTAGVVCLALAMAIAAILLVGLVLSIFQKTFEPRWFYHSPRFYAWSVALLRIAGIKSWSRPRRGCGTGPGAAERQTTGPAPNGSQEG